MRRLTATVGSHRRLVGCGLIAIVAILVVVLALLRRSHPAPQRPSVPAQKAPNPAGARYGVALAGFARQMVTRYVLPEAVAPSGGVQTAVGKTPAALKNCWNCYAAAASAEAVLSREHSSDAARLRKLAVATIDYAIRAHQQPDGVFSPGGVASGFFAVELGITYLELRPYLDQQTKSAWLTSLRRVADWFLRTGQLTFYINGNVNLRQTEVMWLAWAATGDARFRDAYDLEWRFAVAPWGKRWNAYGLKLTHPPTRPDGSNGSGYLTESVQGQSPGYDPSYTQAQLDTATGLYVLTREQRYLRLMNLLMNQNRGRVNTEYILDARHGSRKNDLVPFMSPAPSVLVMTGDRADLTGFLPGQLATVENQYPTAMHDYSINFYKGLSGWLALPGLAIEWPNGLRAAPCAPARSPACADLF